MHKVNNSFENMPLAKVKWAISEYQTLKFLTFMSSLFLTVDSYSMKIKYKPEFTL